jgi:DNA-binding response OmpR family regulator
MDKKYAVLIVDDEPDIVSLLGLHLKLNGYSVFQANNGLKGLETASLEKPDIIILDVMMPEMDGFEVAKKLKENPETNDIPIIFLTARTQTDDKIKGLMVGADDYMIKPFDFEELELRIKRTLKSVDRSSKSNEVKVFSGTSLDYQINKIISEESEFNLLAFKLQLENQEQIKDVKDDFMMALNLLLRDKDESSFFLGKLDDTNFLLFAKFSSLESFCKLLIDNFKKTTRCKSEIKIMVYPRIQKKFKDASELLEKYYKV